MTDLSRRYTGTEPAPAKPCDTEEPAQQGKRTPIGLEQEMPFGKYEGKRVSRLLNSKRGASYIKWCIRNLDRIEFADEVHSEISRIRSLRYDERETQDVNPALR